MDSASQIIPSVSTVLYSAGGIQNQARVPGPLYKVMISLSDPAAVGVPGHKDMEMVDDAGKESHEQGYKFVTRLLAGKARLSRLRNIPRSNGDSECTMSSVDLAGDIKVKAINNSRSIPKTYPLIFACMNTDGS